MNFDQECKFKGEGLFILYKASGDFLGTCHVNKPRLRGRDSQFTPRKSLELRTSAFLLIVGQYVGKTDRPNV